jgi:hypothetical protein
MLQLALALVLISTNMPCTYNDDSFLLVRVRRNRKAAEAAVHDVEQRASDDDDKSGKVDAQ